MAKRKTSRNSNRALPMSQRNMDICCVPIRERRRVQGALRISKASHIKGLQTLGKGIKINYGKR